MRKRPRCGRSASWKADSARMGWACPCGWDQASETTAASDRSKPAPWVTRSDRTVGFGRFSPEGRVASDEAYAPAPVGLNAFETYGKRKWK